MKSMKFAGLLLVFGLATGITTAQAQVEAFNRQAGLEAEIGKFLRDNFDAIIRYDADAAIDAYSEDGFIYSAQAGYVSNTVYRRNLRASLQSTADRSKDTYIIEDLKVVSPGVDLAIANFTIKWTSELNGTTFLSSDRTTNVFVRRGGRWQIVADHTSKLPTPVAPVISGLPVGWRRTPANSSNGYTMTVDTSIRHRGKASASIKSTCAGVDDFGSLAQFISAHGFRGKRVRLTGWLRSENADPAGLWMRVDGERRTLGFDNMMSRPVKGTTNWKQYEIVLDIPAEAINIYFGALIYNQGKLWLDDLKLDIVGDDVAVTNQLSAEQARLESPHTPREPGIADPVNLGFENGAVP